MKKIKIGRDGFLKKDIIKLRFDASELPGLQLFNSSDVIAGNPSSNIAIGIIYNWKTDDAPEQVRQFFQRISNYAALTGFWRTTNGARYVFSNVLANPNINKLVIVVFNSKDNGHLVADALRCFWKNGIDKNGIIIGSKAPNPKFEQLSKESLERAKKQMDLLILTQLEENEKGFSIAEALIKALIQEPENAVSIESFRSSYSRNLEFYSETIKNGLLYDDGARLFDIYKVDLFSSAKQLSCKSNPCNSEDESNNPAANNNPTLNNPAILPLSGKIIAKSISDAFYKMSSFIFSNGTMLRDSRKITISECRSITVVIEDPLSELPEGFSKSYLENYLAEFMHGKGMLKGFAYTYHYRIFKRWGNQVQKAIQLLSGSPETRRALISLWDPAEDILSSSPPCLDFIWLCIRYNKLEMHIAYRSHHIATCTKTGRIMPGEGAFVPNLFALANLHSYIFKEIKKLSSSKAKSKEDAKDAKGAGEKEKAQKGFSGNTALSGLSKGPIVLTDFSGHLYVSSI